MRRAIDLDANGVRLAIGDTVDCDNGDDNGSLSRGVLVLGPDSDGIYQINIGGKHLIRRANYEMAKVAA